MTLSYSILSLFQLTGNGTCGARGKRVLSRAEAEINIGHVSANTIPPCHVVARASVPSNRNNTAASLHVQVGSCKCPHFSSATFKFKKKMRVVTIA